jgi:hypothetical protein
MIPALQKEYYPENLPEREQWKEYSRLKIELLKEAKTKEEYEKMNRELLDKLAL